MDMYRRPMQEPQTPRSRLASSFKGPQWYTLAEAPITSSPRDLRASGGFGAWKGGLSSPRRPESARAHPSVSSYPARPSSARQANFTASNRSQLTSTMRSTMSRGDPEAEARLDYCVRRQRMKKMCETFVNPRTGMVKTEDLQKSAKVRTPSRHLLCQTPSQTLCPCPGSGAGGARSAPRLPGRRPNVPLKRAPPT